MPREKRFYTESEIQGALLEKVQGAQISDIAKKLNRSTRSLAVTLNNYENGIWKPRDRKYKKKDDVPFSPGTEVLIQKRASVFFNQKGVVESVGNNSNIRYVVIPGESKPIPYSLSDLQTRGD
ncbi:hypothetical protein K2P56_00670 [Patescibacteria group bacterium]|nr:hypothetical protein [Patescibacteria group bacterium]